MSTPNLTRTATAAERAMLRAWRQVLADVRDSVTLNELARAIDTGDINAAIRLLQLDEATWRPVEEAIRQSYITGGAVGASQVGAVPIASGTLVARFNVRNPRAERWLTQESSRKITEIVAEQRSMVRERLTAGMAAGRNPRSSALDLVGRIDTTTRVRRGGYIGMTSRQAGWVANARDQLDNLDPAYLNRALRDRRFDSSVARAIRTGKPLTQAQIDAAITQLQNRTLNYRAEVIARTESLNALRAGQHESILQAIETGEVDTANTYHEWDASGDSRTRPTHAMAEGQRVPIDQPFVVGGYRLMYPGDSSLGAAASETIQCRCREKVVIDFAGQARKEILGFG